MCRVSTARAFAPTARRDRARVDGPFAIARGRDGAVNFSPSIARRNAARARRGRAREDADGASRHFARDVDRRSRACPSPPRDARGVMGKPWLEGFKFAVYLAVPIALTAAFALRPENLERVIRDVRGIRREFKRAIDANDGRFAREGLTMRR